MLGTDKWEKKQRDEKASIVIELVSKLSTESYDRVVAWIQCQTRLMAAGGFVVGVMVGAGVSFLIFFLFF